MTTASFATGELAAAEKIPLHQQLAWLRQELSSQRGFDLVGSTRPRPSPAEAKHNRERAQAALTTLEWLQQHEADIRAWVGAGRPKVEQL